MVQFLDGTLRSCHAEGWFHDGGEWLILLRWGVRGEIRYGWYVYSPERIDPLT